MPSSINMIRHYPFLYQIWLFAGGEIHPRILKSGLTLDCSVYFCENLKAVTLKKKFNCKTRLIKWVICIQHC